MTTASPYSDIHMLVHESPQGLVLDVAGSLLFPGPVRPCEQSLPLLRLLFDMINGQTKRAFTVRLQDSEGPSIFRVQRVDDAVDGIWYRFRRSSTTAPTLTTLPTRLAPHIEQLLLEPSLSGGGLILVCGQPGSGKTTSACSILTSRLETFGGFAYTIEDPPEILALNGWHGDGYCSQTEVSDEEGGWENAIKELLRSQPVGSRLLLYVSEVRSAETARMMIRAASNGFLVITTSFASDIISGIDTLFQLLGNHDYSSSLASVLRLVLYQKITSKPVRSVEAQVLYSEGPQSRVAQMIRSRNLGPLKDELVFQSNQLRRGQMPVMAFA